MGAVNTYVEPRGFHISSPACLESLQVDGRCVYAHPAPRDRSSFSCNSIVPLLPYRFPSSKAIWCLAHRIVHSRALTGKCQSGRRRTRWRMLLTHLCTLRKHELREQSVLRCPSSENARTRCGQMRAYTRKTATVSVCRSTLYKCTPPPSLRMPLREAAPPIASFTTPARGMSFTARMGTPLFSLRIDRPHSWLCSECARTARPARWSPWP